MFKERPDNQLPLPSKVKTPVYTPDFNRFPVLGAPRIMGGSGASREDVGVRTNSQTSLTNFYTLEEIAEKVDYSPGYLRVLLKEGKIDGMKFGKDPRGIWVTTIDAVRRWQEGGTGMGRPRKPPKP
jgi:hypothetical protein